MSKRKISFRVNDKTVSMEVSPIRTLLDVLREDLRLTGAKEGCGEGECGACTVLIDGEPVTSCLILIPQVDDREVVTVEGLEENDRLHAVQEAFITESTIQCGFCMPGMILSAKALLDKKPNPTMDEVRRAIAGNICRCTGYVKVLKAVETAVRVSSEK